METEGYPDVTLADQMVMEQISGKSNKDAPKDTVLILQPRDRRIHITRCQLIVGFFVIIFTVIIAITASILATKSISRHLCTDCDSAQSSFSRSTSKSDAQTCTDSETGQFWNGSHYICVSDNKSTKEPSTTVSDKLKKKGNPILRKQTPWSEIRLPRSIIPIRYDIQLKIDLTNFKFTGSVNMTVKINTSTNYIVFHSKSLSIDKESVSIRSLYSPARRVVRQFAVDPRQFYVLETDQSLGEDNKYEIRIGRFEGFLTTTNMKGLYLSSYVTKSGQKWYLSSSQLQATDARRVFPCFDEPDRKAAFSVSIIHQPEYTALANMPSISKTTLPDGWIHQQFAITPHMSTYLLAFVVADFTSRNYTFDKPKGYEFRIWARRDAYEQTEHALECGVKLYKYFSEYFNMDDVVPKADHVAVPDFPSGAMENWGLVIYREDSLLFDPHVSSIKDKFIVTLIEAHEIAHTWFGNIVTMKWWDDLWLNEGFASLLMYVGMDHVYPSWNVFDIQVVNDIHPVMVKDALTTSHPVSTKIRDPEEIGQHFDSISYSKGMAIMRMFIGFAGHENFRNGLRRYVKQYQFSNADMSQLWATFSESFNHSYDVAKIMDTWTRQMGYPVVTVSSNGTNYILSQTRFLLDPSMKLDYPYSPLGYKWYIPFTYVKESSPNVQQLVWLNLGSATIPRHDSEWLLGNINYQGYFRVLYELDMWQKFLQQLETDHTVIPEANRAGLIGDAFSLARANLLEYDVALSLTRYLQQEQKFTPWKAFMDAMEFLKGMIANKAAYVQLENYLRVLVAPVYESSKQLSRNSLPNRYFANLILSTACEVGVESAVDYTKSMFVNWMKHHNSLPSDLAPLILSVGIREGGSAEWDYLWNKTQRTSVTSERYMMMQSLTHTQKPWLLWRYINWVFDRERIRQQDVKVVINYFSETPLARMIALEFFLERWDEIVHEFGDVTFLLRDVINDVTVYVNTEYHLKQLERLFERNTPRSATNAVGNAIAMIKANIGWMEANYAEVTSWLDKNTAR